MIDTSTSGAAGSSRRKTIVDALMALLAERPIEQIGVSDIAEQAGISLAEMRAEFSSVLSVFAAHVKDTDRMVLDGAGADMADEPVREKLFDVLMRRLEVLTPHKAAVRSLLRSSRRDPGLALALNALATRSTSWMMSAAGISIAGPKGMVRAQAMTLLYARVLSTWVEDDDPGLARTMSVLDRELARGQRWSGFLDDLFSVPDRLLRGVSRPRRRRETNPDDDIIAA